VREVAARPIVHVTANIIIASAARVIARSVCSVVSNSPKGVESQWCGPLDIRGDHSDVYYALNTGWLIFMARDPQAVYDLNLMALRVAERADVRLPAIVAFDGFFTSHQKRRVSTFVDDATVQEWLGPVLEPVKALDPRHPVTIGPYMNDPDLINNKYQLERAMDTARQSS